MNVKHFYLLVKQPFEKSFNIKVNPGDELRCHTNGNQLMYTLIPRSGALVGLVYQFVNNSDFIRIRETYHIKEHKIPKNRKWVYLEPKRPGNVYYNSIELLT